MQSWNYHTSWTGYSLFPYSESLFVFVFLQCVQIEPEQNNVHGSLCTRCLAEATVHTKLKSIVRMRKVGLAYVVLHVGPDTYQYS